MGVGGNPWWFYNCHELGGQGPKKTVPQATCPFHGFINNPIEGVRHITSNLGVGGSNPSERASPRPPCSIFHRLATLGRFQTGDPRGTQIDRALLKRKQIGRQELAQWGFNAS